MKNYWQKNWKIYSVGALWMILWQIVAMLIHNSFYFASPVEVLLQLWKYLPNIEFWKVVTTSLVRILAGFLLAFFSAILAAALAFRFQMIRSFLQPPVNLFKSAPVGAVVVVLLIWFGASYLVLCVTFMVVFPNVYLGMLEGLSHTDEKLLEMAKTYHMTWWNRVLYLYRPAVCPYLLSSARICMGMSFKSGIAAEIIGLPKYSMGEALYMEKIYLNTAGVFAWTIVIILLSTILEKIVVKIVQIVGTKEIKPNIMKTKNMDVKREILSCYLVSKSFGDKKVISELSYTFEPGKRYCIMGESGCGKTTLLRMLIGLETVTEGIIKNNQSLRFGIVYQEPRLLMEYRAETNLLVAGCKPGALQYIAQVLPREACNQPLREYSGGMLQKVAILRALHSVNDCLLLDEPFTGLDEENKKKMAEHILQYQNGRTLIVVTHDPEEVRLLDARLYQM